MDAVIDTRFERVEKALATLINSISTYTPSPAIANDLVAADAELNQGLEQLSTHQANYAKLLALRNKSASLDTQIRETLTLLTTTRSELIATPVTVYSEDQYPVSYSELLSYARRISKFTQPPMHREEEPSPATDNQEGTGTGTGATPKETHTNGTSTPAAAMNGIENELSAMEIDNAAPATESQALGTKGPHDFLPPHLNAWLNPASGVETDNFFPWPGQDKFKHGSLAAIQFMTEQGFDPETYDPAKSAELEVERKRLLEEEAFVKERERERFELERRQEMQRRVSSSGAASSERVEQKPKQFQLDAFDDDDDED